MTNYTDIIGNIKHNLRVFDETVSDCLIDVTQINYDSDGEVELIVGFPEHSKEPVAIRPTIYTHVLNNTGLCDKNGTNIFVGDIIKWGVHIGIVKWHINGYVFGDENLGLAPCNQNAEIIGNWFQNPELLPTN